MLSMFEKGFCLTFRIIVIFFFGKKSISIHLATELKKFTILLYLFHTRRF